MKLPASEYDDEVIVTSVGFADRQASLQAAVEFDTEKAIADLYAHVSQMPDSAHKRRLMTQVGGLVLLTFLCLLQLTKLYIESLSNNLTRRTTCFTEMVSNVLQFIFELIITVVSLD